ncbi:type II secretion system protein GspK [Nitrincola tapanii]|uniref:General secretion pathway protein GspK n=1 Tax=Nitrincola tapanii TaxID=1708751 RepID=A0A5A9W2R3_9GAMM|nr:type II secretion system protein GspK [Nitrincola tapanii]KAA0874385.1 hypothetical protein E1H14_08930 [Nitrincola tapanii]
MNNKYPRPSEQGFVLVSVLWLLVAMTMAATLFSAWVEHSVRQAMAQQESLNTTIQARSQIQALLFTRITASGGVQGVPWPAAGDVKDDESLMFDSLDDFLSGAPPKQKARTEAGFLRLDDSVHALGQLRMVVQDRGGLIGLTDLNNSSVFESLAQQSDHSVSPQRLRDTLMDYLDEDHFRRLQGAELTEYELIGRLPPANGALKTPLQLRDVMAWDNVLAERSDAWILQRFRVDGNAFINVNTASYGALELVVGQEHARTLIEERTVAPFESVFVLSNLLGTGEDSSLGIVPRDGVRIWWWEEGAHSAHVYDYSFEGLASGTHAVQLNWQLRVPVPDEMKKKMPIYVEHPFFDEVIEFRGGVKEVKSPK